MSFVNIPFPECIALGARSTVEWRSTVTPSWGGAEQRNQAWQDSLHDFELAMAVRTVGDFQLVLDHFNSVRGRVNTFPFKNYLDFQATAANGRLLSAAGAVVAADGTFYLHKRYGSGAAAYDRRVVLPDTPVAVLRTRSGSTSNITGTGASVDYATGAVAITGHAGGDTYAWTGTFKLHCRYDVDRLSAEIVNRQPGALGEHLVTASSILVREVRA